MTPGTVLSLFPGIDLLGKGFEAAGFTVLRGPDPLWAGDVREFHMPANMVEGIIGGSPCQEFSKLNRREPTGYGVAMLLEFARIVREAAPVWFLLENVPGVPHVQVNGYTVQRMHVRASEFGATSHRLRVFQFGYSDNMPLVLSRPVTKPVATERAALASDGRRSNRKGWPEFCRSQGLDVPPRLHGWTTAAKYQAVGNGVHLYVAGAIAFAINMRKEHHRRAIEPCVCGCGRPTFGPSRYGETSCRKRMQRMREREAAAAARAWTDTANRGPAAIALPGNDTPLQ